MAKGYCFMHEDTEIANILVNDYGELSEIALIESEGAKKYLPMLPLSSDRADVALAKWLRGRTVPATRQGIKRELTTMGMSEFEYMLENLGLSLTDHYWLNPAGSGYTWEAINLYTNNFRAAFSLDIADDDTQSIAGKTNFVPNASLKGDLKKKWIITQNGSRVLVKGSSGHSIRQSLCEVLATEIHRRQGKFEYTPYKLIEISSNGSTTVGCMCPNFTDIHTEFVPAIDIVNSAKKRNDGNYYEMYLELCSRQGVDASYLRAFMEYQILTDFVISNTDRHFNNFGVIRDSKTLCFLKPAPIFDSGNSMFYNSSRICTDEGLLDLNVTSFTKKEIQLLKYVTDPKLLDLSLLPGEQEVLELFMLDTGVKEEDTVKIAKAYSKKIKYLREFQGGTRIYSYPYLRQQGTGKAGS